MIPPVDRPPTPAPPRSSSPEDAARAQLGPPPRSPAAAAERDVMALQADLDEVEQYRMPLMAHLIELRDRLIWSVGALVVGCAIGFAFAKEAIEILKAPFVQALTDTGTDGGLSLVNSPFEGFVVLMKVAFIVGLVISSPVISWQLWQFVAPGLYKTERAVVAPLAFSSTGLFLAGGAFCYFVIFPYAFPFFIQVLDVEVNLSVNGYLMAMIQMMIAFGACFQLPVLSFFLARIGVVDHIDLWNWFRPAVIVIFIIAAIITPPDVLTQTLVGIPMVLLYLVGIGIARMFTTKVREPAAVNAAT
jgi:sec-independent protein translocase protein TatC